MNDEQSLQQQEHAPDFGEIQIVPQPELDEKPVQSASPRSVANRHSRQKEARRKNHGRPRWPALLALAVLLAIPVCYVLLCLFGLPLLIKGPLAERLSAQLGRPVRIGEARLSPFSFELHLAEIAVEADAAHAHEPEIARIETVDAVLRPAALLRGKVILEDMRLDRLRATLIRRADGTWNSPPAGAASSFIPNWVAAQGIRLSRGTVHFLDQAAGQKHIIEQIECILPNADGADKAVEPVLSAVVNASPVQIKGRRSGAETRLTLTLNDFDPQQYLSWLPGGAEAAAVSAERADAVLELIVQDQAEHGMALSGTVVANGLTVQSPDETAENSFRLTVPKAQAVLRANPLRRQYALEELHLDEPFLELAGKAELHGRELAAKTAALLNSGGISLTVDKLSLRKGGIKRGGHGWSDVQMELTGFQNATAAENGGSKTASLSFSAQSGKAAVKFNGEADASFALSGKADLRNMRADLLQPYLSSGTLRLAQGAADISGTLRLDGQGMSISDSTIVLRDVVVLRNKAAFAQMKVLNGSDCALEQGISCGKMTLDQADFATEVPALFLFGGTSTSRLAAKTIEINNSAALLPLAGAAPLALSGLNLSKDGQGKLRLAAALGGQGKLEISGVLAKTGLSGALSLHNVDASFLNPYLSPGGQLRFVQGTADLSGTGNLTAAADGKSLLSLSDSTVTVRTFSLHNNGIALLSGKICNGSGCALDGSGLACTSLALAQTDFAAAAPAFFLRSQDGLRVSGQQVEVTESAALLPLGAGQPLPLSNLKMNLSGGTLRLEAAAGGGSIKAEGPLARTGGTLAVTAKDVDFLLFSRSGLFRNALSVKQGSLSCTGQLAVPEGRFSGEFSLDHVEAESSRGDILRWERLAGSGATVVLSPFSASSASLSLQNPVVRLASESGLAAGLLTLLHDAPLLSAAQASISNGTLERAGGASFSGIEGSIAPLRADSESAFALSGTMDGGVFAVKGTAGGGTVDIAELTIERLPLTSTAQLLAEELGADKEKAQAWRTLSQTEDRLDLNGFAPRPDSDFALILALLSDKDGHFSLQLQGVSAGAAEAEIAASALSELRRFRLQAAAAPEKFLPDLAGLPRNVEFLPGDKLPDFPPQLEGYAALFASRPHFGLAVRGCFDKETDRKSLRAVLQKEGDSTLREDNRRREEEMRRLIAEEVVRQQALHSAGKPLDEDKLPEIRQREDLQPLPARQAEVTDTMLTELAQARAEVIREHLVGRMKLPSDRVKMQDSGSCGARAELLLAPVW
jgi:hypothetical protein